VRAALGAGRGRLIAQFLTESLVLAGLGAFAGLALAVPAMRFLEQLVPEAMGAARLTLDWRVLAFATVIAVDAALALGATSGEILLSFGRRGLGLTLCGLAIGLVLAAIASRLLTTLLYGFRPDYIATVAAVSLILAAVATLACFVPARRASLIDPMIALRQE
jgi:ABC-type antimicrobial peptide transport system permease subunit